MTIWLAVFLLAQASPPAARQHLERGYALAQSGDLKAAETELRLAVKLAPNDPRALALLGIALSQEGKIAEATPLLERALKLDPADANTRYNLALNQLRLGGRVAAQANLERVVREQPDHRQALALLESLRAAPGYDAALSAYREGSFDRSRTLLEQMIAAGSGEPNVFRLLAWCHHRLGRSAESMAAMRQAIELAPRDAALYTNGAQILVEQRQPGAARAMVGKALELAPNNPAAHKLKGTLEVERGDLKQALLSFQRAAQLDRSDPEAVERVGVAQRMLFRHAEARATFENGIARFPAYARLYAAYGALLLDPGFGGTSGAFQKRAMGLLNRALALDAALPDPHYELGKLLLEDSNAAEALPHLEAAARLDPRNRSTHLMLANAYRILGRATDQAAALARYHELEPVP